MIWGLFGKKDKPGEPAPEQAKGLFDGLRKSSSKLAESFTSVFTKEKLDAADIAELEETLIASDMGAAAAARIAAALADQRFSKENGAHRSARSARRRSRAHPEAARSARSISPPARSRASCS